MKTFFLSFRYLICVIGVCLLSNSIYAQDPSALIEFESTTQGILIPRMLQSERVAIAMPANGLLVYQTDSDSGFYFNYGTDVSPDWQKLGGNNGDQVWTESPNKIFAGATNQLLIYGDTTNGYNANRSIELYPGFDATPNFVYDPLSGAARLNAFTLLDSFNGLDDIDSFGIFSFASGVSSHATGSISTAMGLNAIASGDFSTAISTSSEASGIYSGVFGGAVNNTEGYSSAIVGGGEAFILPAGDYSVVAGGYQNRVQQGQAGILGGYGNSAQGRFSSIVGGFYNTSHDVAEVAMGMFNTVSDGDSLNFNNPNRLLSIGNGLNFGSRSNAFEVFHDGRVVINEAFTFPTLDGVFGQVMSTDGAGLISWTTLADNDPTNEIETWSTLTGKPAGFADNVDNVNDADNDPTNEIETWTTLSGIPAGFSDNIDNVNDADNDPTNEIELPAGGMAGHFLQTDGSNVSWTDINLETDLGIGTTAPISEVHIRGEDSYSQLTLAPMAIASGDTSAIFLAEDEDATFGMAMMYDGNDNKMKITGEASTTSYGPHLTIERNDGDVEISSYTKLGSDAPNIKMKKLSGTTGAAQGTTINFPHGIANADKIISINAIVRAAGLKVPPGMNDLATFEYSVYSTGTLVFVRLDSSNSNSILNAPIDVLITYEE